MPWQGCFFAQYPCLEAHMLFSRKLHYLFSSKFLFFSLGLSLGINLQKVSTAQAQSPPSPAHRLTINEGLSQNNVTSAVQDQTGFLWIGTLDGLNRYDGYEFRIFRHFPGDSASLSSNTISALLEDRTGAYLWIATMSHGLNRMDLRTGRIQRFTHDSRNPNSLPDNRIRTLALSPTGNLWIGTRDHGLVVFDAATGAFSSLAVPTSGTSTPAALHIRSLLYDRHGNLWIGTMANGLFMLPRAAILDTPSSRAKAISIARGPQGLSHARVEALAEDARGRIWVGTYGSGVDIFDVDSSSGIAAEWTIRRVGHYEHQKGVAGSLSNNIVETILRDHAGNMWVGTAYGGLNLFHSKTETFLPHRKEADNPASLSSDNVDMLYEDAAHNLWIGTWGGGLNRIDLKPRKFHYLGHNPGEARSLGHNYVRAVAEDPAGNIWIGSSGGGLDRIRARDGRIDHIKHNPANPKSLQHDDVRAILFDREGNLWVGTYGGGIFFAGCKALRTIDHSPDRLPFERYVYAGGASTGPSSNFIWCILEDREGVLWFGTNAGLNRFDPATRRFRHFHHDPVKPGSLSHEIVRTLYEDRRGNLWVGTYDGLNRLQPETETFYHYRHDSQNPNSLSHSSVTAITADSAGALWIGTLGGGLNRFDSKSGQFRRYSLRDGLPNLFIHGLLFDRRGRLWISSNGGLSVFDERLPEGEAFRTYKMSDGLQSNEFNAGAALKCRNGTLYFGGINGLTFFDPDSLQDNPFLPPVALTDFRIFNKSRRFSQSLPYIKEMFLSHKDTFFAFEFASLDFTVPSRNQYAYKLEGFDSDWIQAGHRRYAGYTNIPPGNYTFRVRASNNDGVWNEQGLAVKMTIVPAFWHRWWFRTLVLLAAVGLMLAVVLYRIRLLRRQNAAQKYFSQRLVEAQEQERKRLAGELHDSLGQDLIIVNNMLQQNKLQWKDSLPPESVFDNLSQEILRILHRVRKLSSELHPHLLERLGLVKAVETMARKMAASSQIETALDLHEPPSLPPETQLNLYRILQEILNNTVKHSRATQLSISMQIKNQRYHVTASDNGIGFDPHILHEAHGLGFASIRHRVQSLNGEIRIRSRPGKGTRIELSIPLSHRNNAKAGSP